MKQLEVINECSSKKAKEMKMRADLVRERLDSDRQRLMDVARERGASVWLSALPLKEFGFDLHKGSFRDAICIRYGWQPPQLPSTCVCGKAFNVDHALSCPYGGFPTLRHNELRDLTATLMKEVCHNVSREPPLQPLSGETLSYSTAGTEGARLDVAADEFWGIPGQRAFFDVRVVNPFSCTYRNLPLSSVYKRVEEEKKRKYDQRVREIEHGSFSPLAFSTSGGLAPISAQVYKRIATMQSEKLSKPYNTVINFIRCKLSFSLLRSTIRCLRGTRSTFSRSHNLEIDVATSNGQIVF